MMMMLSACLGIFTSDTLSLKPTVDLLSSRYSQRCIAAVETVRQRLETAREKFLQNSSRSASEQEYG